MNSKIRWGIVATGNIAHRFANGLKAVEDAELIAVSSRTQEKADKFADQFDIKYRHVGAAALAANDEVDVIYVSSPHSAHKADTITCLNGGKPVICEKPFAINGAEVQEMVDLAREKGVFLMEAIWTLFFPAMRKVRELIKSGAIGEVRQLHANFCFRAGVNPEGRLFNPELGGGALLDVGIYTVALARMVFGKDPSEVKSFASIGETKVDEQTAIILGYDDGAFSLLSCAVRTNTEHSAVIYGTDGYTKIPHMFWKPEKIVVKTKDTEEDEIPFERIGNGYNYEATDVMECLRKGFTESSVVPLDMSIGMMETLDTVREQIGLVYPMEGLKKQ